MKLLHRLAWRLKWNWQFCAWHHLDEHGVWTQAHTHRHRCVYAHKTTGEVRYVDLNWRPFQYLLEGIAIGLIIIALLACWFMTP